MKTEIFENKPYQVVKYSQLSTWEKFVFQFKPKCGFFRDKWFKIYKFVGNKTIFISRELIPVFNPRRRK